MRRWWPFWRQERHQSSDNHKIILSDDEISFSKQILDGLGRGDDEIEISIPTEPHYSEDKDIVHIRQSETWDCGLTCIQMILQWLRESNNDNEDKEHINADGDEFHDSLNKARLQLVKKWLIEYVATESIWTIDLVMLLQHIISDGINSSHEEEEHSSTTIINEQYKFSYLFCSTKFGVDKTYNNIGYYKDSFTSDEIRVNNLFDIAEKQCLPLLETSTTNLTLHVLANIVSRKGVVAIVLLDNRILKNLSIEASTYCGHYVILCGISRDENDIKCAQVNAASVEEEAVQNRFDFCMILKNPGICKQVEYVSPCVFDKARVAKGTDQDVIFIAKDDNNI